MQGSTAPGALQVQEGRRGHRGREVPIRAAQPLGAPKGPKSSVRSNHSSSRVSLWCSLGSAHGSGCCELLCVGHQLLLGLCKPCYLFMPSLCACLASHRRDLFSSPAPTGLLKPPSAGRIRLCRWNSVTQLKTFISVERVASASGDTSFAARKKDAKCSSLKPVAETRVSRVAQVASRTDSTRCPPGCAVPPPALYLLLTAGRLPLARGSAQVWSSAGAPAAEIRAQTQRAATPVYCCEVGVRRSSGTAGRA